MPWWCLCCSVYGLIHPLRCLHLIGLRGFPPILINPGIPRKTLGNALVQKGTNFVSQRNSPTTVKDGKPERWLKTLLLEQYWQEFLEVYRNRPNSGNRCGIRLNHAYALFLTVKQLQPKTILESGVNAGQSTYFLRQAAKPHTPHIYSFDPADRPICGHAKRWLDTNHTPDYTHYYLGKNDFVDVTELDWSREIEAGRVVRNSTLVFSDDHLNSFERIRSLLPHGFVHVLVEDNYMVGRGSTEADRAGFTPKQLLARRDADAHWFWKHLQSYSEFPPLVAPSLAHNYPGGPKLGYLHSSANRKALRYLAEPLLRVDLYDSKNNLKKKDPYQDDWRAYQQLCEAAHANTSLIDEHSYQQVMNYNQMAYLHLRP